MGPWISRAHFRWVLVSGLFRQGSGRLYRPFNGGTQLLYRARYASLLDRSETANAAVKLNPGPAGFFAAEEDGAVGGVFVKAIEETHMLPKIEMLKIRVMNPPIRSLRRVYASGMGRVNGDLN